MAYNIRHHHNILPNMLTILELYMHITSTPKHPQSNRAAERAVKIIRHADQKPITEVDMYE